MADLTTDFLGLALKNPLVPSASPLSQHLDTAKALEEAGAAALIMHSLFEEKVTNEDAHLERFFQMQSLGHAEADSFHPVPDVYAGYQDQYLEQLRTLKEHLSIPVIASLNGTSPAAWVEYGALMESAGADALELNVYYMATNPEESSQQVEDRYVDVLTSLREQIDIPIAVKLSSQFSAPIPFCKRLEAAGANGISIFNRFYQPDINLETLQVEPKIQLSNSHESLLRIRWAAILFDHLNCSLAVTGGIHNYEDMLKALMAGADITCMCSELLENGAGRIGHSLQLLDEWLDEHEYDSIRQLKGSISYQKAIDPAAYERANYISVLDSYSSSKGVWR